MSGSGLIVRACSSSMRHATGAGVARCWAVRGAGLPHARGPIGVWQSRHCTTHSTSDTQSEPPFVVRAGLVGAGTALLTPAFPVIGLNQLVFRFVDPQTRLVITGGTSMLWFSAMTLMPNAFYYAPILLPFAVGNGMTAAGLYVVAECAAGGPKELAAVKLGWIPLAGPLLGVATALLVPFVYPASWSMVYPEDFCVALNAETYRMIGNVCFGGEFGWIIWPCLSSTGLAAGALMHIFLKPVILGVPGIAWTTLAGGILVASAIGLAALYSTSIRTSVPHLNEVNLDAPELQGWFFPSRAPCYIKGEQELLWTPGLDLRTGEVVSERRQLKVSPSGAYEYPLDKVQEKGLERAAKAQALLSKTQDRRARCYLSQRAAFFDGFMTSNPLDPVRVQQKLKGLPVGETVVTDLVVLLVAGSVPQAKLEESVRQLLPQLKESSLAARLGSSFWRTWAADSKDLLMDAALRAAQFRELCRLERGCEAGPLSAEELAEALNSAGVDVQRAKDSLKELSYPLEDQPGKRIKDWNLISSKHQRQKFEQAGGILLGLATIMACAHVVNLARQ